MSLSKTTETTHSGDETTTTHPSFGMIQISRCQGSVSSKKGGISGVPLFGSPLKHSTFIAIRVCEAKQIRSLHSTRYYAGKQLVEIYLSPSQFAEALTNMNTTGTPCTLSHVAGKSIPDPPEDIAEHEEIQNEFKKTMNGIADKLQSGVSRVEELLSQSKPMSKAEKAELLSLMLKLQQELRSNIPFIHESFVETVENTTQVAKTEITVHAQMLATQHNLPLEQVRLITNQQESIGDYSVCVGIWFSSDRRRTV